jgi:ubiquitin-protein ligase
MAILKEDWSPFLNLAAVFGSLDCLLEEPDPQYAASLTLQQEYLQ